MGNQGKCNCENCTCESKVAKDRDDNDKNHFIITMNLRTGEMDIETEYEMLHPEDEKSRRLFFIDETAQMINSETSDEKIKPKHKWNGITPIDEGNQIFYMGLTEAERKEIAEKSRKHMLGDTLNSYGQHFGKLTPEDKGNNSETMQEPESKNKKDVEQFHKDVVDGSCIDKYAQTKFYGNKEGDKNPMKRVISSPVRGRRTPEEELTQILLSSGNDDRLMRFISEKLDTIDADRRVSLANLMQKIRRDYHTSEDSSIKHFKEARPENRQKVSDKVESTLRSVVRPDENPITEKDNIEIPAEVIAKLIGIAMVRAAQVLESGEVCPNSFDINIIRENAKKTGTPIPRLNLSVPRLKLKDEEQEQSKGRIDTIQKTTETKSYKCTKSDTLAIKDVIITAFIEDNILPVQGFKLRFNGQTAQTEKGGQYTHTLLNALTMLDLDKCPAFIVTMPKIQIELGTKVSLDKANELLQRLMKIDMIQLPIVSGESTQVKQSEEKQKPMITEGELSDKISGLLSGLGLGYSDAVRIWIQPTTVEVKVFNVPRETLYHKLIETELRRFIDHLSKEHIVPCCFIQCLSHLKVRGYDYQQRKDSLQERMLIERTGGYVSRIDLSDTLQKSDDYIPDNLLKDIIVQTLTSNSSIRNFDISMTGKHQCGYSRKCKQFVGNFEILLKIVSEYYKIPDANIEVRHPLLPNSIKDETVIKAIQDGINSLVTQEIHVFTVRELLQDKIKIIRK